MAARRAVTGGIDIGGTSVRLALVDTQDREVAFDAQPRPRGDDPAEHLRALAQWLTRGAGDRTLLAVGVGCSGPVDPRTGLIENPWTLPGWEGTEIRPLLEFAAGVPVRVENDADVAAAAELALGAGQGAETLAMLTLGTGVGGAVITRGGGLLRGADLRHPEIGHHVVAEGIGPECYCGATGCLEALVAGPGLARTAEALRDGGAWTAAPDGPLTAEAIAAAADSGDPIASAIFRQAGVYVGRAVRNLESFYAPDVVVIGGGLGERLDLLTEGIEEGRGRHTGLHLRARLLPAALGDRAGALGAAILAREVAEAAG